MVLDFLQCLVMNALESFRSTLQNSLMKSRSIMKNQLSGFKLMSEAVANHHHAKTVLERMDANDEAALEDFALQEIIIALLKSQTMEDYCIPHINNDDLDCEEATSTESVDPLAALVDKKLDTNAAILCVRLVLKSTSTGSDDGSSPLCISVVPSFEDFDAALNNLLNQYKEIINTFGSLLKDGHILPLISTSKYDFMMLLEEEESASIQECKAPWMPVQALLCDYTPYRVCTNEIRATLRVTLEQCCKQCSVSINYFVHV